LGTIVTSFVTISCDTPSCDKTITFPQTEQGEKETIAANPWMNSIRFANTLDGRKFTYCSDECEAKAVGFGQHNKKVIVPPTGANTVDLAAQAQEAARKATEELKKGPVTLA
jgi:hypothetical protein